MKSDFGSVVSIKKKQQQQEYGVPLLNQIKIKPPAGEVCFLLLFFLIEAVAPGMSLA